MGYNGWSNYETWAVKLWLDNEEGSYYQMTGEATSRAEEAKEMEEEASNSSFADYVREYIEEGMPDISASVYSDLLNSAMGEVDWYEIAESYLKDAEEGIK